jgi:hypothetical protein
MSYKPARGAASPLRLTSADFDAFLPSREVAGARMRLELRQRILAWARSVVLRLAGLDIHVETDERSHEGSVTEGISVVLHRNADACGRLPRLARSRARAAAGRSSEHANFGLSIDAARVAVSIAVPLDARLDVENLRARLGDPSATAELTRALVALPEQFAVASFHGDLWGQEAAAGGAGAIERGLERAGDAGDPTASLWIGWAIPREVAVRHSALLDEQLEDAIVALGPVYKLIAWTPENDRLGLASDGEDIRSERGGRGWDGRGRHDRPSFSPERRDGAKSKRRATDDEHEAMARRRDGRRSATREVPPSATKPARLGARPLLHSTLRKLNPALQRTKAEKPVRQAMVARRVLVTEVDPSAPVEKGTRVRVLAGPFVGKVGVVQELDGKGGARVMLGLLATRLDVKDLIASAEGRERPGLSTSHRKPLSAR